MILNKGQNRYFMPINKKIKKHIYVCVYIYIYETRLSLIKLDEFSNFTH